MIFVILILIFINIILGRSHSGDNGQTKAIFCTKSKALHPPPADGFPGNSFSRGLSAIWTAFLSLSFFPFSFAQNKIRLFSLVIEKPVLFDYNNH